MSAEGRTKYKKCTQSKGNTKTSKRYLVFDEESIYEEELLLSDNSSEDFDPDWDTENLEHFLLEEDPKENYYILAEFNTRPKKYYVGVITNGMDDEREYEVSYLRKKRKSNEFFPQARDIASIKLGDIKAILPKPSKHTRYNKEAKCKPQI